MVKLFLGTLAFLLVTSAFAQESSVHLYLSHLLVSTARGAISR
ncbi:MAG: hypothetical protein ACJASY_004145 [Halioglobus sp.]|jgi:hypothetical protein